MTEQEKNEIIAELEARFEAKYKDAVSKDNTHKVLSAPREKWFKDENGYGNNSLMAKAVGSSTVSYAIWERVRTLTCYICGKRYVRQLSGEDHADEVAEKLCQLIYDLAMERKKDADDD